MKKYLLSFYILKIIHYNLERALRTYFDRVIVNDSTSFILPKEFKKKFPGSGGSASPSSIKVQLQYELLTGSFMNIDIFSGIKTMLNT